MADENVKIVIQEDNLTNPIGSGVSSDVVYVPGLAIDHWPVNSSDSESEIIESKKNIPVLCSSISEFESAFGPEPYQYEDTDLSNCPYITEGTYVVGGYDKSYLYARELLNAGLSVLYENIAPEVKLQRVGHVSLKTPNANVTDVGNCKFAFTPPVATTSSDNTLTPSSTEVKFSIALNYRDPMVGTAVTVAVNMPKLKNEEDVALSITSGSLTCDKKTAAFTVSPVEGNPSRYLISIVNATTADFETTKFTLALTFAYNSAAQITAEIGVDVVEGDVAGTDGEIDVVSCSRIENFYNKLLENMSVLKDKNEYSVKYITTGGYPSFVKILQDTGESTYSLASGLIDIAKKRGDAVALIDHPDHPELPLGVSESTSFYHEANEFFGNGQSGSFGAMFTPWATYNCVTVTDTDKIAQFMPASFGYLLCVASAIQTSPNWLAMAGVTRGSVPNIVSLHTNKVLSNMIAEDYQPKYGKDGNKISINAITNVRPYGLTIWGNRTLQPVEPKGTTALNFLNTRNMVSDIKKLAYQTAKELMFEQDSDTLWLSFKSGISPLLEQLKSGNGISDYKIIRSTTKYNGKELTRGELAAVIKIYPKYAIEYFEITVVMSDDDVAVS